MKPHHHHHHNQRIAHAAGRVSSRFPDPLRRPGKAFLFYILIGLSLSMEAQQASSAGMEPGDASQHEASFVTETSVRADTCLLPVYFNYRRRILQYNGRRIDGNAFLEMCRSIPDSSIWELLKRYDGYTAQKQSLVFSTLGSSFAGIALIGGALGNASPSTGASPPLIWNGVVCLLAAPVLAICTTGPHQRRKTILFRDLPIMYNAYAEAQRSANACP